MTYTEQDIERVAAAMFDLMIAPRTPDQGNIYDRLARAALEAMEREQLEDVLDAMNVEYVALSRRQWDEAPRWDADIDDTSRTIGKGKGDTVDEAIRNAVAAAKGEKA